MSSQTRDLLLRQFRTASSLLHHHLHGLTAEECLWRPSTSGPHVRRSANGEWVADWPEHEGYDLGPPSIAWTTWHIGFWWSMVLDHSFGEGALTRADVAWPGAAAVAAWLDGLEARWRFSIEQLDEGDLAAPVRTRWPFERRPFADVVAWATVELAKNAAEIGMVRFLYAVRNA